MTPIVVAFVSMFLGDICQAVYVILLGGERIPRWRRVAAGVFDGLDDLALVPSVGAGTLTLMHWDGRHLVFTPTWAALGTCAAIVVASAAGAYLGYWLAARFKHDPDPAALT